ncbi:MAG: sigma factor [Aeromicrobium sp.]|uniref:sigma factor n=1 Tax=Aeromicrobium sp. TaxID=1871063 RepID=UPI003C479756
MDSFVRQLLEQTPLTSDEERRLAGLARAGDQEARSALVVAGMRAVVQRALLQGLRGETLRDGVQAGAIGLMRAVDRFDPDRGVRLATYAWAWIGAALRSSDRLESALVADHADGQEPDEAWTWLDGLAAPMDDVVRLRCGVGSVPPMSRREVARHLDLTESQVRTIEAEAMRHLRGRLARIGHRASPQCGADPP